jgi:hypothetical protein
MGLLQASAAEAEIAAQEAAFRGPTTPQLQTHRRFSADHPHRSHPGRSTGEAATAQRPSTSTWAQGLFTFLGGEEEIRELSMSACYVKISTRENGSRDMSN